MSDLYVDLSDAAIDALGADLEHVVEAAAEIVRDEIVAQMEPGTPRTGETYRVPETRALYTASAPGEAPAVREGHYVASWKTDPAVRTPSSVIANAYSDLVVGKNGEYLLGELLEHGTHDLVNFGVRMEPRPHIEPGVEAALPKIEAMLKTIQP